MERLHVANIMLGAGFIQPAVRGKRVLLLVA